MVEDFHKNVDGIMSLEEEDIEKLVNSLSTNQIEIMRKVLGVCAEIQETSNVNEVFGQEIEEIL